MFGQRYEEGSTWNLYRATVPSVAPGWKVSAGLPLGPGSALDPGWPVPFVAPGSQDDPGGLLVAEPLVLYRLLDASGAGVENRLRLVRSGAADIRLSY